MDPVLRDALRAELNPLATKLDETRAWIESVEQKFEEARRGSLVVDNLRAVLPDAERRNVEQFARTGHADPVKAAALNAWFKLAARAQMPQYQGRSVEIAEQLAKLSTALNGGVEQRAAFSETDANGGYLTPTLVEANVYRVIADNGIVRPLARKLTTSSDKVTVPSGNAAATAYVVNEATAITDGGPTFSATDVVIKKFAGYTLASAEVLDDSAVDLQQYFVTVMAEQIARLEDQYSLEGTAGDPYAGLFSVSGVNAVTNGTDGALPTYAKLVTQKWAGGASDTRMGSAWVMAPQIAANLEGLVDSNGRPLFVAPIAGNNTSIGDAEGSLLGKPMYTSNVIKVDRTTGSANNTSVIYFGPFGKHMLFIDRTGLGFAVSPHVKFAEVQVALRLIKRTGIYVAVPAAFTKQTGVKIA